MLLRKSSALFLAALALTYAGAGESAAAGDQRPASAPARVAAPPAIAVWHGANQPFGAVGTPQRWVNILGNISDPDGITAASYTLNGGAPRSLSLGPDGRRLRRSGDFNIDLLTSELWSGSNTVVITAQDGVGELSQSTVSVNFSPGNVWPLDYQVGWSSASTLMDSAQVVDGRWVIDGNGIRPSETGYDRLVALGDTTWEDYEITTSIVVHAIDSTAEAFDNVNGGPAVGFLMRWNGHTDTPQFAPPITQPLSGYLPYGMIGWFHWRAGYGSADANRWELMGNDLVLRAENTSLGLAYEYPYYIKMRVKTVAGVGASYSLKVWEEGQIEPFEWLLSGQEPLSSPRHGSVLLLAHHVHVTFGPVRVVPLGALTPPVLASPANGATNQPASLPLRWRKVSAATSYHVQVATSSAFDQGIVVDDSAVTDTARSITGLASGTTYHWRVRAQNVDGAGGYSSTWSFASAVGVPPLLAPASGASSQPTSLTFRWGTVAGATSYGLQVGADSTFASGLVVNDPALTDTTRLVTALTNGTRYFWRVRAANGGGAGAYSAFRPLTTVLGIPPLVSPAAGATGIPLSPALVWNAVKAATHYAVQVGTDSTFAGGLVVDDAGVTDTTRALAALSHGVKYFWRVQARSAAGNGAYTAHRSFAVILAAPAQVSPPHLAAGLSAPVSLIWKRVAGATAYRLQAGLDSTYATGVLVDTETADTTWSLGSVGAATRYYWSVRAMSGASGGAVSPAWAFTTQIGAAALLAPPAGAVNQPTSVTLIWSKVPLAATYWLQLGTDSTFAGGLVKNDSSIVDTQRAVNGLSMGMRYFWRISSKNGVGRGAFSPASVFRTAGQLPGQVVLVSPADLESLESTRGRLVWLAAQPLVTQYWTEVALDSLFAVHIVDSTVTDTTKTVGTLVPYTWYYWRVRARNTEGWGSFSVTRKFWALPPSGVEPDGPLPAAYALRPNYPNPFNPSTTFEFDLPRATNVRIRVFTMLGQEVVVLAEGSYPAGRHRVRFDASRLPSGVYLCRLTAGEFVAVQKMLLTK